MVDEASSSSSKAAKPISRKQNKPDQTKRHLSIFEAPPDFFESCRLFHTSSPLPDVEIPPVDALEESESEKEVTGNSDYDTNPTNNGKSMQRLSCNTCKAEFESLQEQRFHFKSDLHRFNIKLSVAGKSIIKEEDFDEATTDSLSKEYDVSSISGSDDEDERETGILSDRKHERGGLSKNKIFIQLKNGEIVSVWKCLLLDESDSIAYEPDKPYVMDGTRLVYLTPKEVVEKLKYVLNEPRDNSRLRIVLLARGGHFAGCVFDGDSLLVHKTFHRYVVRAKAGKKQSSKDAGTQGIHSAGASLRRYNEFALKKDIQEVLTLWKPHFAAASCIFIYAPSNNRQLFFDGDKPCFTCQHRAIRNIPLTVRRPTLKEARRIYGLLLQVSPEIIEETAPSTKEESLSGAKRGGHSQIESSGLKFKENLYDTDIAETHSIVTEMDGLSVSIEPKDEINSVGISTSLHEAAKSGDAQKVLELLEQGLDPSVKDKGGQTPYMLASEKEVRNTFRRFMASNLEIWDWNAAKVPSPLTKEMEESQAAKQAEKDAKRKAKAKELKKLRKAKEKKAQAESAESHNNSTGGNAGGASHPTNKGRSQSSGSALPKEEEVERIRASEREKRAAAAERRMAQAAVSKSDGPSNNTIGSDDILCSCCNVCLAGKVPFHRYHYKYCSSSCMHLHREILEDS